MNYFADDTYREFIYLRTYARWRPDLGRRENWLETVDRYMTYMEEVCQGAIPNRVYSELQTAIISQEVLPSMRLLWSAGEAAKLNPASAYNCSYLTVHEPRSFAKTMFLLMSGTGVGFSCEERFVDRLPFIPSISESENVHVVKDSREGWADALLAGLLSWYRGTDLSFNYELVRPRGAPLKTFGGRASGPEPLQRLMEFTREKFYTAQGRKLTSLEVHDIMCMIGEVVVAGGTRRSSLISLSDLGNSQLRNAKSGDDFPSYRFMANNSVAYNRKPTKEQFDEEWDALVQGQSGERGIFNRAAGIKGSPPRRQAYLESASDSLGTNPCQPGWATVLTPNGIRPLSDVTVGDKIWGNGGWTEIINKWSTGVNKVYRYRTSSGVFVGTEDHRVMSGGEKIPVVDAETIDIDRGTQTPTGLVPSAIMSGLLLGDGSVHKASNNLIHLHIGENDKDYFEDEHVGPLLGPHRPGLSPTAYEVSGHHLTPLDLPKTPERRVPASYRGGDPNTVASFLRGLYSANGSVVHNRITLKTASPQLCEDVQVMLSSLGIHSYFTTNRPKTVEFQNGSYRCKESYDINITRDRDLFMQHIGFIQQYKNDWVDTTVQSAKPRKLSYEIREREFISREETFHITVDNPTHTYWTGGCHVSNCGEIFLRPNQMCNLTNVVIRPGDDRQDIDEKVRLATILGTYQSALTDFSYLSPKWRQTCEEERLLGVSLTGIYDNPEVALNPENLREWRHTAVETNHNYAKYLGINKSSAITCIKPSGNTSQLVDSSSGAHPRYAPYYMRRVRISASDPLFRLMRDQGVNYSAENGQSGDQITTYVLEFPRKSPENAVIRSEMDAIRQLEDWKTLKTNFTEHTVSATIYVGDSEWAAVKEWLWANWEDVGGLSFLPKDDGSRVYRLAPYEELSEHEYIQKVESQEQDLDFTKLVEYENHDNTIGSREYACVGGACELD